MVPELSIIKSKFTKAAQDAGFVIEKSEVRTFLDSVAEMWYDAWCDYSDSVTFVGIVPIGGGGPPGGAAIGVKAPLAGPNFVFNPISMNRDKNPWDTDASKEMFNAVATALEIRFNQYFLTLTGELDFIGGNLTHSSVNPGSWTNGENVPKRLGDLVMSNALLFNDDLLKQDVLGMMPSFNVTKSKIGDLMGYLTTEISGIISMWVDGTVIKGIKAAGIAAPGTGTISGGQASGGGLE